MVVVVVVVAEVVKWRGDGGGDSPLSLLLLFLLFLSLFSLFCMIKWIPGCGAFLIRSLAVFLLPTSSFCNSKPAIGFSASKKEMSWKTSFREFCLLNIFFELTLLILFWVMQWLMSSYTPLEKLLVADRYYCMSSEGISASLAILP